MTAQPHGIGRSFSAFFPVSKLKIKRYVRKPAKKMQVLLYQAPEGGHVDR